MGLMRFVISPPNSVTDEMIQQAYMSGLDRTPWEIHVRQANGELILERMVADSGALQIPWPVEGYGHLVLSTGTLLERDQPYYLPLELARGKVGQIRSQQAEWESVGLAVPSQFHRTISAATHYLGQAVQAERGSENSVALAERAIHIALTASNLLAGYYTEQALLARRRATARLPSLLGVNLGNTPLTASMVRPCLQAFSAGNVPLVWRHIEIRPGSYAWNVADEQIGWCRSAGLTACAGPLVQFDARSIPEWLSVRERDVDSLITSASEFIQAAVQRYRGDVDLWLSAGRVNTGEVLSLSEEAKVRLAARSVELIHALDPQTPILVSLDQPWAEYLSRRAMDFPPLHFADALLRAGLGLTGLMLEINVGFYPGGTPLRDPLDVSRLLDYWGLLGAPIYVAISVPSGWQEDPLAQRRVTLPPESWSRKAQQAWVHRYVPLILAKSCVQGIFWNQLRDGEPHDFPHGGLFDADCHPKPALRQLASIRQAYLK